MLQVSENFRFAEQFRDHRGTISYELSTPSDEQAGTLDLNYQKELGTVAIAYVVLSLPLRYKGLGRKLYEDIPSLTPPHSLILPNQLYTFVSSELNGNSRRIWESLVRTGDAVLTPSGTYQMLSK